MAENGKQRVLVVVQLSGGNDFLNTVVPYSNPHYYDARPKVVIREDEVLPIDDTLGFNPNLAPLKELYDEGSVAVIQGIGYPNSSRSHFRSMDVPDFGSFRVQVYQKEAVRLSQDHISPPFRAPMLETT